MYFANDYCCSIIDVLSLFAFVHSQNYKHIYVCLCSSTVYRCFYICCPKKEGGLGSKKLKIGTRLPL